MNFILSRDRTYASTLGHSVEFKKGVPTYVPRALWAEVQNIGAIPEDEIAEEDKPTTTIPEGEKRTEDLLAAFELLVSRNQREDFGANGVPTVQALTGVLGWKPVAQERDVAWASFMAEKGK